MDALIIISLWALGCIASAAVYTYWAERSDDGVELEAAVLVGIAWPGVLMCLAIALPSIWLSSKMNHNHNERHIS